jgi:mannitol/fructose-specific phosphotransferase system IIA component (Ntr-type)
MNFKETFKRGTISANLQGTTKHAIIAEMIDMLVKDGKLPAELRDAARQAVMDREKRMSTGMQCGVAIPHGKLTDFDQLITAFAVKKEGIDFGSQDGLPSQIFVMTISSALRAGPHLQYLAEISRLLSVPTIREKILNATTAEEIITILTTQ